MPADKKIVDLEVRVSYQDRMISELDEVVCALAKRIEQLERNVRELTETVQAAPEDETPEPPPPHY